MNRRNPFVVLLMVSLCGSQALAVPQDEAAGQTNSPATASEMDIEVEMRAAEASLEQAARRIAELSTRQLPVPGGQQWAFAFSQRPMLGITIDGESNDGPVEGVVVRGVSPGGAAFDAGLRSGDIISAINKESMSAANSAAANKKLLDFMEGVEEGDTLDIEYRRDGKVASIEIQPQVGGEQRFAFGMPGHAPGGMSAPHAPFPQIAPGAPQIRKFMSVHRDVAWRDMELVPLTKDLGKYFGTEKGLLVVRAPAGSELQLHDGDVIQSIDGREPASISHAVRILSSYQAGEKLKLEIMRDKRRRTLTVEIPDDRQSRRIGGSSPVVVDVRRHIIRD